MSMLNQLSTSDIQRAVGRTLYPQAQLELDRTIAGRIAWILFRRFEDQKIRVPFLFGIKWTVRLGDIAPLWAMLFGPEPASLTMPDALVFPFPDPAA